MGTRQATDYGREQTERLVRGVLPHQPLVVSGLAYGIDILAHRAALQEGPAHGGRDGHRPRRHLPRRAPQNGRENARVPAACSPSFRSAPRPTATTSRPATASSPASADGTVVVEAAAKGGALITAELALSYDRDVLAVPGNAGLTGLRGLQRAD